MQVEALKRYRTGGEQKVTVQHVTVNEGGQAIIGSVSPGVGELIKNGRVPLVDIAQIDGVLDAVPVPKRRPLLAEIEEKCRDRADDGGLATIARWRQLTLQ